MIQQGKRPKFDIKDGILRCELRLCVPNVTELRKEILRKAHSSGYSVHLGSTMMYRDIQEYFWWDGLKRDVEFVARCLVFQQVKAEHQRPALLLQPLLIPECKWENIAMDFVTRLSRSISGNNAIWVIVDRLTKFVHFLAIKNTFSLYRLAELYKKEIVRLCGVLVLPVSNRDTRFTSQF